MFSPTEDMRLISALVFGANLTRARIVTPTLQMVAPMRVHPFVAATSIPTNANIANFMDNPPLLRAAEQIDVQTTNDAGAGVTHFALLNFRFRDQNVPTGQRYVIRGTGTTTLAANAWTVCPITWETVLPAGRYAVVGLTGISVSAVAVRLAIPGVGWRPGVSGLLLAGSRLPDIYNERQPGYMGEFTNAAMPQAEFLATAADTAQEVYMHVIKL